MTSGDRINEVYYGKLWSANARAAAQDRIAWICERVRGPRVLDIGCSQGIVSILLARAGREVIGIDVDADAIEYAKKELEAESDSTRGQLSFIHGDALEQGFEDDSFDTVIMGQLLEHVPRPEDFLELARRVCRADGRVIITTPFGLLVHPDHLHTFYPYRFVKLVSRFLLTEDIDTVGGRICLSGRPRRGDSDDGVQVADERLHARLHELSESEFLRKEREKHEQLQTHKERAEKLRHRVEKLEAQTEALRNEKQVLEHRTRVLEDEQAEAVRALRSSATFRIGEALVAAVRPGKGTLALPFRLWRIYRDYRETKRQTSRARGSAAGASQRKPGYARFPCRMMYVVGWRLVDVLTPGQRRVVARLLPARVRRFIEDLLTSGERSVTVAPPAVRAARQLSTRLRNLGFVERAVADLQALVDDTARPRLQRAAAWELCVWYADQCSMEGARKCLELLPKAIEGEGNPVRLRRAAVLEAESLAALGAREEARRALSRAMDLGPDADLYLAAANLESSLPERVAWINRALELHGLARISLDASEGLPPFYRLKCEVDARGRSPVPDDGPKVSVIMPAYNAEGSIRTALDSVLAQTWANLEVLVVDDCSEDGTAGVVAEYGAREPRVRLLRAAQNRGTYVARNLALAEATGEFVTCHDTDDWDHPEKIEKQVVHLVKNPSIVANTSQWTRVTPGLDFVRRGNPGFYVQVNMSSLMFRRRTVVESVGYWDSVRFGADGEFTRRVRRFFGEEAVHDLRSGPLAFAVQSDASLTGHKLFGYHGGFTGVRKEYLESYSHFHATTSDLRLEFPQQPRPFPVPEPMWPVRESGDSERRHFDVILASEFRFPGGTTSSNVEEIKAQKQMGLRTGLLQMARYESEAESVINPKVREIVDGDRVQMVVHGEDLSCDVLILRHPSVLQERQQFIADVKADHLVVVMNQPPCKDYGADGRRIYDIPRCADHLKEYFGESGVWYPIGPWVRETLHRYHADELNAIQLADEDWVNIIAVDEWRRPSCPPRGRRIRIGRHSRDDWTKWPGDRNALLSVYPDSEDHEVRVLGGAEAVVRVLGGLPKNWQVMEFGAMHPKDFLSTVDVFVYYTHPDWVEAFGRTIFEAMAVGVPVILPYTYKELFREAAIYAEPSGVKLAIQQLMGDDDYYQSRVETAWDYVEKHFGYSRHAARLSAIMRRDDLQRDRLIQ